MHLGSCYFWWMLAVKSRISVLKSYIIPPILSLEVQEHFLDYVGEKSNYYQVIYVKSTNGIWEYIY